MPWTADADWCHCSVAFRADGCRRNNIFHCCATAVLQVGFARSNCGSRERLAGPILVNTDGFQEASVRVFVTPIGAIFAAITQFLNFNTATSSSMAAGNCFFRAPSEAEIGGLIGHALTCFNSIAQLPVLDTLLSIPGDTEPEAVAFWAVMASQAGSAFDLRTILPDKTMMLEQPLKGRRHLSLLTTDFL